MNEGSLVVAENRYLAERYCAENGIPKSAIAHSIDCPRGRKFDRVVFVGQVQMRRDWDGLYPIARYHSERVVWA